MDQAELAALKVAHATLLAVCDIQLTPDDNKKIASETDFCRMCITKERRADFLLKLFSLQEDFRSWMDQHPEAPPAPDDKEAAQVYLDKKLAWIRARANAIPPEQARSLALETMREFGAHFTGKLIHSSAVGASMLATERLSNQPHISSRRLRQAGIVLPLDQSQLDNSGVYQRILWVLDNDPIVEASGLDSTVTAAIRQGIVDAARQPAARSPYVDHRLRQVLLPDGNGYIAASPLASAGLSILLHQAVEVIEEAATAEDPEDETKSHKPRRGRPRQDKTAEGEDAVAATEMAGSEPAIIGVREAAPDTLKKPPRRLFKRVALPFGGGIPRNATLHGREVQESFCFPVPQYHKESIAAWRFVFQPWRPWIIPSHAKAVAAQVAVIEKSSAFQDSASLASVDIQAARGGAMGRLARACHEQAVELAQNLPDATFHATDNGEDLPIDEDLLRQRRPKGREPSPIDLAIVNQRFGAEYREAMAEVIVESIRRLTVDPKTQADALSGMAARQRAQRAIEKVLEAL